MTPQYIFADWLFPISRPPIEQGWLRVEAGRIMAMGSLPELAESERENVQKNLYNQTQTTGRLPRLLCPGFVNTHAHLELSFGHRVTLLPTEQMGDWLMKVSDVIAGAMQAPDAQTQQLARCRLGAHELLQTGTTCVSDIASGKNTLQALDEAGLRGIVCLEFFYPHTAKTSQSLATAENLTQQLLETLKALSQVYGEHPRLKLGISPHAPYNVSPWFWQHITQRLAEAKLPIALTHTHLAESSDESAWLEAQASSGIHQIHRRFFGQTFTPLKSNIPNNFSGTSSVAYCQQAQCLQGPFKLLAAHGVYLKPDELTTLATLGVGIAHCPRSNLFLQGKSIHWPDWQSTGISLGLGTDSHLSTPDLDLRAEARTAMQLHGWSAQEALFYMTLGGAGALGLAESIGSFEVGKQADWVLLAPVADEQPQSLPETPQAAHDAVLSAHWQVMQTAIAGQVRYDAGSVPSNPIYGAYPLPN